MGRPIKKKFFGNLNNGQYGNVGLHSGLGGESVATSITVTTTGTGYSQGSVAVFSAPNLPTGTTAAGTLTIGTPAAQGRITAVTLTNGGTGYTGTATVTITTATAVSAAATGNSGVTATNTFTVASVTGIYVGMVISGGSTGVNGKVTAIDTGLNRITSTVNNLGTWANAANLTFTDYGSGAKFITTLTSNTANAISGVAYLLAKDGGASAKAYDIVKQEASHRYLVTTADGIGQCKLVATDTPTVGQMTIIATDENGSTYWVTKLTARRCVLSQRTMSTAYLFADGASAGWNITGAVTGKVSIAHTN